MQEWVTRNLLNLLWRGVPGKTSAAQGPVLYRDILLQRLRKQDLILYNKGWIQGLEIASDYNNLLWLA